MKRLIFATIAGVSTVALMTAVLMANAQQVGMGDPSLNVNGAPVLTAATFGGLSGQVVSASATIPQFGDPVTAYTTPSTGNFVLTQFCVVPAFAKLSGSSFGAIVGVGSGSDPSCTSYGPGLALPTNETITLSSNGAAANVTITGVLQP